MKSLDKLSLGWRTDLIFPRFDGELLQRSDCLVVRTPHNPTFWWGNFLLFDHAPRAGDAARWLAAFDAEIVRPQPQSRHLAFGIDASDAFELPRDFVDAGLTLCASTVLTMRREQLRAPRALAPGFSVRPLRLADESALAVDLEVACDEGAHEPQSYRVFRERQIARYRAMHEAGLGEWFGVFAATPQGQLLVADCGLFHDGHSTAPLGRFQLVATHPAWRRHGLCTALVHAVCRHAFERMHLDSAVIVADPDDVAIGIYESLGFQRGASTWHLERRPPEDAPGETPARRASARPHHAAAP